MTDIVKRVDNLERALGQGARILDGNQYPVQDSARRQSPARKVIALAAPGQKNECTAGYRRKGTPTPETSFLQLKPHQNHHAADKRERPSITKRLLAFEGRVA
jgi:hypothetical protein